MAPRKSIRSVAPLSEELREVLSDHEAGQERLLTLAQVEGDTLTLRHYSQILQTGSTVMRTDAIFYVLMLNIDKIKL